MTFIETRDTFLERALDDLANALDSIDPYWGEQTYNLNETRRSIEKAINHIKESRKL